jgi:hypothetical protein
MLLLNPALFQVPLMQSTSSCCTNVMKGDFTSFQRFDVSCVHFTHSIFSDCSQPADSDPVYGGAICYDNPSGAFELFSSTFFSYGIVAAITEAHGGAGYLKAASIEIDRCCARECYSVIAQAFCFVGCQTPSATFSGFVLCSLSDRSLPASQAPSQPTAILRGFQLVCQM